MSLNVGLFIVTRVFLLQLFTFYNVSHLFNNKMTYWTCLFVCRVTSSYCVIIVVTRSTDELTTLAAAKFIVNRRVYVLRLSVCLSVCVSATLMLNISDIKRFRGSCQIGTPYKSAYGLVKSWMTSRDSMT